MGSHISLFPILSSFASYSFQCDLNLLFSFRYCTEILSLLPFALPEEPLYLIYAINRVIQVRAGGIESNMKTFLHRLQGYSRNEPANGIVHQPFAQPLSSENASVNNDWRQQEFPGGISFTQAVPVEFDQRSVNPENPIIISPDDLPKIQVIIREILQFDIVNWLCLDVKTVKVSMCYDASIYKTLCVTNYFITIIIYMNIFNKTISKVVCIINTFWATSNLFDLFPC